MSDARPLKIGDQVTLHYRLTCNGREIIDTFANEPETFRLGQGDIDPRLEILLLGLQAGEHRIYELDAGAAFGSHDSDLVHTLPRADFIAQLGDEIDLTPGLDVEFTLPNGQTLNGILLDVDAERVKVDFNHPLAGRPVVFEVKIFSIPTDNHAD
jgi:FKBP-type peptidyl-prolyl cis-trans isomerase SlpA